MSILIKSGEFIELEGANSEISRLLGQLEINRHETDLDKIRISGAETLQLDASTLHQLAGQALMRMDGAVVDFTTGQIFQSDGVTPLGINFTPATIPAGEYLWVGLSVNSGNSNALNESVATIGVDLSDSSNAVQGSASLPSFCGGGVKRGWVQIQNNGGNIEVVDIKRLTASTSGADSQTSAERDIYENRLDFSLFNTVSANVFAEDGNSFTDPTSTGSIANNCFFRFSNPGETYLDLNNATSTDFLAAEVDLFQVELFARWDEANIDPSAVYELSRDGGNEYQTLTMTRVGTDSNSFRGFHIFGEEAADQNLEEQLTANADRELTDTGLGVRRAVQITLADPSVLKTIALEFNKVESSLGNLNAGTYRIQFILDDSGNPSTNPNDIISETPMLGLATLASGIATETVDIPNAVKNAGSIVWVVITTNASYKALFVTGVDSLSIRVNTAAPHHTGSAFNGLVWAAIAEAWVFQLNGRALDLRLRVTSSTGGVQLASYGIFYHEQSGTVANTGAFDIDIFSFLGDDNVTNFPLVNIQDPIPGLIEAFDETEGNAYLNGSTTYQIVGNTLIFVPNFFNRPGQNLTLKVRQLKAGIIDNSDPNAAKIQANELAIVEIRNNQDKAGGVSGGIINAYTIDFPTPFTSLVEGQTFVFTPVFTNTGASTLNVDGLGDKPIGTPRGAAIASPLTGFELLQSGNVEVMYNAFTDDFLVTGGADVTYSRVQDDGVTHPFRQTLNFTGAGVLVSDDAGSLRTTVDISGASDPNIALRNNANNFSVQQNLNSGLLVDGQGLGVNVAPPADGLIRCTGFMQADGGYRQPGGSAVGDKIYRAKGFSAGGFGEANGIASAIRNSLGTYTITFSVPFAAIPTITGSSGGRIFTVQSVTIVSVSIRIFERVTGNLVDNGYDIICQGRA